MVGYSASGNDGNSSYSNCEYGSDRAIPLHDPSHSKVSSRDKPIAVHQAPLSGGINAMTLPELCIGSASLAGVAARIAASCRSVAAAIKALRQVPASNVASTAIPTDAGARVIAFDVVVTQAVLPPLPGRRNGESADMGGHAGADPCPAARGTAPALGYGSEAR
jgi:hypothetical protein